MDAATVHRRMHEAGHFTNRGPRHSERQVMLLAMDIVGGCKSVIDYGCGSGRFWRPVDKGHLLGLDWGYPYDPYREEFSERPPQTADMVWCRDVLEHVPEDDLPAVFDDLDGLADKLIWATICTTPAPEVEGLPNSHFTIRPPEWWREKLIALHTPTVYCFTEHGADGGNFESAWESQRLGAIL